jgi:hypothetical protein
MSFKASSCLDGETLHSEDARFPRPVSGSSVIQTLRAGPLADIIFACSCAVEGDSPNSVGI